MTAHIGGAWSAANKEKLLGFLDSVDGLEAFVVREPVTAAGRQYDEDSLQILPQSQRQALIAHLQTWRAVSISAAMTLERVHEVLGMGRIRVPWLRRMMRQLGDLDTEIEMPPFDLDECRASFEVVLLEFFVQQVEDERLVDAYALRDVFHGNNEFMRAFRQFAKVLQVDTARMRAAYARDKPCYFEAAGEEVVAAESPYELLLAAVSAPEAGGVAGAGALQADLDALKNLV
jgi:hypothetical protein